MTVTAAPVRAASFAAAAPFEAAPFQNHPARRIAVDSGYLWTLAAPCDSTADLDGISSKVLACVWQCVLVGCHHGVGWEPAAGRRRMRAASGRCTSEDAARL